MKIYYITMNNNTKNSDSDIPQEVLELVSWYAIGKLSVGDQTLFEKSLIRYPLLEKHLQQELRLIETVSADKSLLNLSAIAAQDERLKSVLNMIDVAETQDQTKDNSESVTSSSLLDKFKNAFDTLIPNLEGVSQYARVASIGVLVLSVAALTAFIAPLFTETSDFIPASAVSQPKGEQSSTVNASNTALLVGFNGTSVELGNNDVLKGKLAKVETVPDKEGVFQISFKQVLTSDEIKQTIDALLAQDELIWFAGEEF